MKDEVNDLKDVQQVKDSESELSKRNDDFSFKKRVTILITAVVVAFLLGFVPMWLSERGVLKERNTAQTALRLSRMQNSLGTATIQSRRGEYEQARSLTSDFYTDLRTAIEGGTNTFTSEQKDALQPILAQRDEIITILARNDPAGTERLADLYLGYNSVVAQPQTINPKEEK